MDWHLAITRNRDALLAIVAAIVALLGGRDAGGGPIARRLRSAALALLRPAEAAARRLIVIAARGLSATPRRAAFPAAGIAPGGGGERMPAFRLFDPPRSFAAIPRRAEPAGIPRIRTFWSSPFPPAPVPAPPPAPVSPDPDAPVEAGRLRLRLAALERALADLPRQARRLVRWRARRDLRPGERPRLAMRPGRPPGSRARPSREVDFVLSECHALALDAAAPDTS